MSLWSKKSDGTFSTSDRQDAKPKYLGLGQLQAINFTGTGTGYTNGASFTISAPPTGGVQATATAVVVGGSVTGATITNPGAGYSSATPPTVTLAGGSGQTFSPTIYGAAKVAGANSNIVFVDQTEAQLADNRARGVKIPGWTKITNTIDNAGNPRYRVETLVAMTQTAGVALDAADDVLVADVTGNPITVQPTNQTTVTGGATFTITVSGTGQTYQWQVKAVGASQYVNVPAGALASITYAGGTTASLTVSGATSALIANGTRVRCQVYNAAGQSATSNPANLTYGN